MKALLSSSNTISTSQQEQEYVNFSRSGLYSESSLLESEPSFIKLESIDDTTPASLRSKSQERRDENNSPVQSLNLTNSSQFWRDFFNSSSSSIPEHSSSIIEDQIETCEIGTTVSASTSDDFPLHVHPPPLSRFPLPSPVDSEHRLPEVSFEDETDAELMCELMKELNSMTESDRSLFTAPPSRQVSFADDLSTQFVKDLNLSNFSSSNNTLEGESANHINLPNISLNPSQDDTLNCGVCKKRKSSSTPSPSLSFDLFSPFNPCNSQKQSSSSPELFKNWSVSHVISNSTDTGIVVDATPLPALSSTAPTSSITSTSVHSIASIANTQYISSYTSTPVVHLQKAAPTRLSELWQKRNKERGGGEKDHKQLVSFLPRKRRLDTVKLNTDTHADNGATPNYTETSKTQKISIQESPDLF